MEVDDGSIFEKRAPLWAELFELDAISNPEPGTLALFALGAMGLGGVVVRRRRRRARDAAESV